ncbi:HCCA isomerase/glutathione S-transferase kappa [Diplogelasinospora grovesii]|uniref:Glutathione S-transferase kappa n=1 Tax=Diplogelasinospora grovesii TaxID=303347 RepID=A0AAN6NIN2_9PEZI|nr:HCCA isomerase/glutathione S-transferase kappa [Diplogelasinospora grovesii]
MARPKITLYLDTVSPFAYEAYYILRNDPVFKSVDVTYVPIFLGGLMNKCGNTPPIQIKNKDKWINTERLRWASHFNIPITHEMPPDFPPLTLHIMRAACALQQDDDNTTPDRMIRALDHLFARYWVDRAPTHQPDVLKEELVKIFGLQDTEKILKDAAGPAKKQLIENTDLAFSEGAFGLPWMVCTNSKGEKEGFWGVDHLGQIVRFLGVQRPGEGGWKAVL